MDEHGSSERYAHRTGLCALQSFILHLGSFLSGVPLNPHYLPIVGTTIDLLKHQHNVHQRLVSQRSRIQLLAIVPACNIAVFCLL